MKFTEMRSTMQSFSGAKTEEYQMQYMTTEVKDVLNGLNNKFVEYLTNDLTDSKLNFFLKNWLTNTYYNSSNENAKECIEICPTVQHLYGRRIKAWTDNALKCYDNFLLKYIQEDLKETIKKQSPILKERDVYQHLVNKGGEFMQIGEAFNYIYQTRNEFQHVQIIDHNGIRIPKVVPITKYNEKRDLIINWFKSALILMLDKIK
jgi:hypothetical protein